MSNQLRQWDPFRDLSDFQQRLASMFEPGSGSLLHSGDVDCQPAVDVSEDDSAFTLIADLPEVKKEDAHVMVKEGMITISGERKRETGKKKFHRVERSYGKYTRSFQVPEAVDPAAISAEVKDGVLTVVMPKSDAPPA